MAVFLVGVVAVLGIVTALTEAAGRALASASQDFRRFVVGLGQLAQFGLAAAFGAYLHARWSAGEEEQALSILIGCGAIGLQHLLRRQADDPPDSRPEA